MQKSTFSLPALPYPNNGLEPYINTKTLEAHHDLYHKAYVTNLTQVVKGTQWEKYYPWRHTCKCK